MKPATVATPETAVAGDSLWRNRDFLALWSGQIVSTLGSRTSSTAMPLLVLAITGSPSAAGLVGAAGSLPFLIVNMPAGSLVDRWNRRRIMLVSELGAGQALVTIPIALRFGLLGVPQLVVVALVQGTCSVFFGVAEHAALPKVVGASMLPAAVAQNEAKSRGTALIGPPLGGLLFGLERALPFLADAVSYLVSTVALLAVRGDLREARVTPPESLWREAVVGLRWVWRHSPVRAALVLIAISNMVFQALTLTIVVLARHEGSSSAAIGVMLGIYGGGGLVGALVASRLHTRLAPRTVILASNWVWAALLPLLVLSTHPVVLGAICSAAAFIGPLWNVVVITYVTQLVPNELMGRVAGAAMTLSWGVIPVASLSGGYLLAAVGPTDTVLVLSVVMLATAIAATLSPAVRHLSTTAPPGTTMGRDADGH